MNEGRDDLSEHTHSCEYVHWSQFAAGPVFTVILLQARVTDMPISAS